MQRTQILSLSSAHSLSFSSIESAWGVWGGSGAFELWKELLAAREELYNGEDLFFSVTFWFGHGSSNIHNI